MPNPIIVSQLVMGFLLGNRKHTDSVAVYQNVALDSTGLGDYVFVLVGPGRTWEKAEDVPKRMPDGTGGIAIGWKFQLQKVVASKDIEATFKTEEEAKKEEAKIWYQEQFSVSAQPIQEGLPKAEAEASEAEGRGPNGSQGSVLGQGSGSETRRKAGDI